MTLSITQLFTPQASGVVTDPTVTPSDGTWYADQLTLAAELGLPTTAWQSGQPERTMMAIQCVGLAQQDVLISIMAQGGFLQFAANGSVTTVDINGVSSTIPVTPDPSNSAQNPTGAPGWLDALLQSFYACTRLQASYATGSLSVANTGSGTVVYSAGAYHVANTVTGATYNNPSAMSVAPSIIAGAGGTIVGVAVGTSVTVITTGAAHGVAVGQVIYVLGTVGVNGLNGKFGVVSSVTATTITIALSTTGAWTSGGTVYLSSPVQLKADVLGVSSNAAIGAVTTPVTQNTGVYIYNSTAWSASNFESNPSYYARGLLSLAARSPNGASQAYEYFALTAAAILAAQSNPVSLTNGPISIATAFANPQTGIETILVASTTFASTTLGQAVTPGCAQLGITGATNASPIVVSTASPHGLSTGNQAIVAGVLGNTAANGAWTVTVTGASTLSLNGSTANAAYVGGGTLEGGDLGLVDNLIQKNVTPDGIVAAVTQSALAFPVTVSATVVVPQALVATYQIAAAAALAALQATFPIGGLIQPGATTGTVSYSAVEGALSNAGVLSIGAASYVQQITNLTVNSGTVDVNYPGTNYLAIFLTPSITVVGV